jgi:hypothetical protein
MQRILTTLYESDILGRNKSCLCIYVYNIFVTDKCKKKWLEPHLGPFIQQKGLFLNLPSISIKNPVKGKVKNCNICV